MRVFVESQRFRQWWFIIIALTITLGIGFASITEYQKSGAVGMNFLGFIIVIFVFGGIFALNLETKINSQGILAEFKPLGIAKKRFNWSEIDKCYVRTYAPIMEYGGWGIRSSGKSKAYNVSGNKGIQIITKDGRKFLIGTNKPKPAEKVLQRYLDKKSIL